MHAVMPAVQPHIETIAGAGLQPLLPALARLRVAVFREWPYLYDGSAQYEHRYLDAYAGAPGAAFVICRDGAEIVGASTCVPMAEGQAEVREAFVAAGRDPARICYLGESVLLPAYRGQGIGVAFFAAREAHARRLGLAEAAFCAVDRAPDDPRRPADHVPLDGFWARRGYAKQPHLQVTFSWQEVGITAEVANRLTFWTRRL
jgi:GNAT superfamily N-acetyltransferase